MKKVFFILFCVISSIASATSYYVSSTTGDDSRDGKSEATAWKTISKVNAGSFSPGDIIAFKKGDVWRETLEVPSSGASGNYIKFTGYGTGINPRILGSKATTTWTNQGGNIWKSDATFSNPRSIYPNYNDITFQYSSGNFRFGVHKAGTGSLTTEYDYVWSTSFIYVYAATDPAARYIGIEVPQRSFCVSTNDNGYLHFDGIDILHAANTGMDSNNDHTVSDVTGCIIENCEIGFIGGTSDQQYGFGIAIAYSELTIRNCQVHHCGRRGISINMEYTGSPYTVENILIENNTFYGGSHTTSLDMTVNNGGNSSSINGVIFRFNLVYEDPTSAVSYPVNQMWFQRYSGAGSTTNVKIYSNIFKSWRNNCISSEGFNGFIYVYNNTFYENNTTTSPSYCYYADTDRGTANHVIKNNIFYTTKSSDASGNGALIVLMLPSSYLTCNYNLFYRLNNSVRVWLINGSSYYMNQIATIRSTYGWETNSPTPANPAFTSTSDYHLKAGSPAIGKGISIPGITTDFDGNLYSGPPNIGSYATSTSNICPVISITFPAKSSSFTAPATITINAIASDPDGTISRVEFFSGTVKIGETSTTPYTFVWKDVVAGTYSLTAIATDNQNATATSSAIIAEVSVITLNESNNSDANKESIVLYPNPNTGRFSVDLANFNKDESSIITIFDLTGKVVYKGILSIGENTKQFDLSHITAGIYIIKVNSKKVTSIKKFSKN